MGKRRIVCALMALCMVLTWLPIAASAEVASESDVYLYPFCQMGFDADGDGNGDGVGFSYSVASPKDISYENSGDMICYYTNTSDSSSGVVWNGSSTNMRLWEGNYGAFKIKVPKKGTYTVDLVAKVGDGSIGNVYIVPLSESASDYTESDAAAYTTSAIASASPVFEKIDFGNGEVQEVKKFTSEFTANKAGEYIFVIKRVETSVGISFRPITLTLTGKTAQIPDDVKVIYPFCYNWIDVDVYGDGNTMRLGFSPYESAETYVSKPSEITYAKSNDLVEYYTKKTNYADEMRGSMVQFQLTDNDFFAFKIQVPRSGVYEFNYCGKVGMGSISDMFIFPISTEAAALTEDGAKQAYVDSALKSEKPVLEGVDLGNDGVVDDNKHYTGEFTAPVAGEYIFAVKRTKGTKGRNVQLTTLAISRTNKEIVPDAPSDVVFCADASNGGEIAVRIAGSDSSYTQGSIASVARGTEINLIANEAEGKTFRCWVRGSADNGIYLSNEPEYSINAMSNTLITAIYETNIEAEKTVEFYNANGEYIATKAVGTDNSLTLPENPTLTGHVFKNWFVNIGKTLDVSALNAGVTRAVAGYDENSLDSDTITVDGEAKFGVKYNDRIDAEKTGATYWTRNGKTVAYGESYTYYAWGSAEIVSHTDGTTVKPLVVLDEKSMGGAHMIEYDAGGKEIAEVGILFGGSASSVKPTIESCASKATSQRGLTHGQFTASGEGTARGYLIYRDGTSYKVVYSD